MKKVWIVGFLVLILGLSFGADYIAYNQIQKQLPFKIHGKIAPKWLQSSFIVEDIHFQWQDRVQLMPGDLEITYDPLTVFKEDARLKLEGHNLQITLLGDWAKLQDASNIQLKRFFADLGLNREGVTEIYGIEAIGPQFQFVIQPSES